LKYFKFIFQKVLTVFFHLWKRKGKQVVVTHNHFFLIFKASQKKRRLGRHFRQHCFSEISWTTSNKKHHSSKFYKFVFLCLQFQSFKTITHVQCHPCSLNWISCPSMSGKAFLRFIFFALFCKIEISPQFETLQLSIFFFPQKPWS
jgi:hypothetical protein